MSFQKSKTVIQTKRINVKPNAWSNAAAVSPVPQNTEVPNPTRKVSPTAP